MITNYKQFLFVLSLTLLPLFLSSQVVRGPYLQAGGTSHMTIRWRTDSNTDSKVWYGTSPTNLTQTVSQNTNGTEHEIKITGLSTHTQYYYGIGDGSGMFAGGDNDHFFYTHPSPGYNGKVRLWILGDSGTKNKDARSVRDAYYNHVGSDFTDLILMLGDNAYPRGTDDEYQDAIFNNMYEDIIVQTPIWPCPGNHDTGDYASDGSGAPYWDIFTLPTAGESGGLSSGTEHYFSMDYGDIHVISLNTQNNGTETGDPMLVWLENDLAATTQKWIFVIFHHPPYSKASHDSDKGGTQISVRENINPILENYGVDLVMAGHSHAYERSFLINGHYGLSSTFGPSMQVDGGDGKEFGDGAYQKDVTGPDAGVGAVYVVAGSAGKTSNGALGHPAHYYDAIELGSVYIETENNRMDLKFIDAEGNVDDYFTLIKENINGLVPSISLTAPVNGQTFNVIQPITFSANANDPDGNVSSVDFFIDGSLVGSDGTAPYDLSWTPPGYGSYTLFASASDNDNNTTNTQQINILIGQQSTVGNIAANSDDAEENGGNGKMVLGSGDIDLVNDGSNNDQKVGLRFTGMNIPVDANIISAYIQFTADEAQSDPASLTIQAEASDDAQTFINTDNDITNRPLTTAAVSWSPASWSNIGDAGLGQQTTDIKDVIQEVVDRPGYASTSAMAIIISGTGKRVGESFEGDPSATAVLHINYSTGPLNNPPSISLTSPADGAIFTNFQTIDIDASASDSDGSIAQVEFFVNGVSIGTDNSSSYSQSWTPTANGTYSLSTTATDNEGVIASSSINVTVNVSAVNNPPTVSITDPADGDSYSGLSAISINAAASDSDGNISQVSFFVDGSLIGSDASSPYATFWTPSSAGTYELTAEATDNDGAFTLSGSVSVSFSNTNTGGGGTSLSTNSQISLNSDDAEENNATGAVAVNSSDLDLINDGGSKDQTVGLRFTGLNIPIGATIDNAYIQFTADEVRTSAASLIIHGENVDDAETFSSSTHNISTRPLTSASIVWDPASWLNVGDAGTDQQTTDLSTIIQEIIDRPSYDSTHAIAFIISGSGRRAAETHNSSPASAPHLFVDYTTAGGPAINLPPTVNLTSPADGAILTSFQTIDIDATASDSDGSITQVEFFVDGVSIGTDLSSNYSQSWAPTSNGTYSFSATATDDEGFTAHTSISITVNVLNNPPSVDITSPSNGATYTSFQSIDIDATANDSDGNITQVEFFVDGVSIGTDNSSSYSQDWTPTSNGTYSLSATATDDEGATTSTSVNVTINVAAVNNPPTVGLTDPLNGASFSSLQGISIDANASDSDGNISQIAFFVDGNLIGSDASSPYGTSWTPVAAGTYELTAEATDNDGTPTLSAAVSITFSAPTGGGGTSYSTNSQISLNSDDAEENNATGAVAVNSSDLDLINDGGSKDQTVGLRFTGLNIPIGATIDNAYIQFTADEARTASASLTVHGDATVDAVTFSTSSNDITNRPLTASSVSWDPAGWLNVGDAGVDQQTSDLSSVIQEIIDQSGYDSTHAIAFIISGSGRRAAEALNSNPSLAPHLFVDYTTAGGPAVNAEPTVNLTAPADGAILTSFQSIDIDATASDSDGNITQVEFFVDGVSIGTDNSSSYSESWTPTSNGTYSLSATATDDEGATASTSVSVTINVAAVNNPPTVSITDPIDGASYSGLQTISIDAIANDNDGNVTRVEFLIDGTSEGIDVATPFSLSWTPSVFGSYIITAEATDDDGSSTTSSSVSIDFIDNSSQTTATFTIADGDDDAEEHQGGAVKLSNSDLELVYDGGNKGNQTIGLRFPQFNIPVGATVTNAYVQFTVDEAKNNPGTKTIYGEAVDDAPVFVSDDFDLSSRASTNATVSWDPLAWNVIGETGLDQRTADISSIIQEIIDRPGWNTNQAIAILLQGTGTRTAVSYNGSPAGAASLVVSYSGGGAARMINVEAAFSTDLVVFPNPFEDRVNIQLSFSDQEAKSVKITLTDLVGRTIDSQYQVITSGGIIKKDLTDLSTGLYLLKIEVEGQILFQKIEKIAN